MSGVAHTAVVFELVRDDRTDYARWRRVIELEDVGRMRPTVALSHWIAQASPGPGSYRIEIAGGGCASVWVPHDREEQIA